MSSFSMEKAGNDPAHTQEVSSMTTNVIHGTGFIESESPQVENVVPGKAVYHQTMPKNDLGQFLTRLTPITSFTLSSSDSALTFNLSGFDPWAAFLANPAITDKTNNFTYIRGTLELYFMVAVPGNCYGSYVASALPNGGPVTTSSARCGHFLVANNCMQVDHWARVDCADSQNLVLQLPFLWPYDYALLPYGPVDSWRVYFTCLSPLQTSIPGGVASGNVKVYARCLDDVELVVPHLQGKHSGRLTANKMMATHAPEVHKSLTGASSKLDKVAKVADKLSGVPVIGPYAGTAAKAAHAASKVASWFGFTRDEAESTIISVANRSVSNLARCDGDDASEMAALTIGNSISIDPTLSSTQSSEDCMSTTSLFARWTIIDTFTWSASALVGEELWSTPVTPNIVVGDASSFVMTPMGWFGMPFKFWRGSLEYMIILPVSKLHRGTFQLAWLPLNSVATGDIANITLNAIVDVSAGGEHTFIVGYARDKPFVENRIMLDGTVQNYDFTNGRLVLRVVNPLQSQSATASVTGVVLVRGCNDLEYAVPRADYWFPTPGAPTIAPFSQSLVYQGASGDEDLSEPEPHVLVPLPAAYPSDQILFGERIGSVRMLLQKPSEVFPVGGADTIVSSFMGMIPGIPGATPPMKSDVFCFAWWYKVAFVGFAASERYKVITGGSGFAQAYHWNPIDSGSFPDFGAQTFPTAPMTWTGAQHGAEFTIPYYSDRKFISSRHAYDVLANRNVRYAIMHYENVEPPATKKFFYSFGPDIRCAGFRQIPRCSFPIP